MSTFIFESGTIVSINNKAHTLLRMVSNDLWQLEEDSNKRIHEYTETELLTMYGARELIFSGALEKETFQAVLVAKGDSTLTTKAKIKYAYAKATLGFPSSQAILQPIINEVWKQLGCVLKPPHFSTVCRWRRQYLAGDKSTIRLIDQYHKRGNRTARYPETVTKIVDDVIDRIYMTLERPTIQDALDQAKLEVIRENKRLPTDLQLPFPSFRMVRGRIESIPKFDRDVARYGRDAAAKMHRSTLAHRITYRPLERAEIDHTRMDMMVVDDETGMPLGRPWLTLCIEDFTRCILGAHVGFAAPSYVTVAQCLQHAFQPKTRLKETNPEIVNDWLMFGIMRELVVDNGMEFHSSSLENACLMLGIEIHFSARKTPWFKGKVERVIGSLNRGVAHGNPGTTFSDIVEKGDYDPMKHAVVRLSALKRAVNIWIVDHYHQKPHRTLKMPPEVAWRNSISLQEIRLPEDPLLLEAITGISLTRSLSHKGIEYNSLYYNSHEVSHLRRLHGEKLDVEIRVNTEDISQIHLISPDKKMTYVVPAVAKEYATGLSEWQHNLCKKYAAKQLKKYDDPTVWLEAKEKIREIFGGEKQWKEKVDRANRAKKKRTNSQKAIIELEVSAPKQDQNNPDLLKVSESDTPLPVTKILASTHKKRFSAIQENRSTLSTLDEQEKTQ